MTQDLRKMFHMDEIEDLVKHTPTMMLILPEVIRDSADARTSGMGITMTGNSVDYLKDALEIALWHRLETLKKQRKFQF